MYAIEILYAGKWRRLWPDDDYRRLKEYQSHVKTETVRIVRTGKGGNSECLD